jgi:hypothetical protein
LEFIDMPSFDWMKGDSAANDIIVSDPKHWYALMWIVCVCSRFLSA